MSTVGASPCPATGFAAQGPHLGTGLLPVVAASAADLSPLPTTPTQVGRRGTGRAAGTLEAELGAAGLWGLSSCTGPQSLLASHASAQQWCR